MDEAAFKILELEDAFEGPECVLGKSIADLVTYIDPPGALRKEIRRRKHVHAHEWNFKTLKGTEKWLMEDSYLVQDPETGEDVIQVITRDITSNKRAEQALHASERRFRETLESVQMLAVQFDAEGLITFCNDYLLRLTGWTREDLLGRHWLDRFIPKGLRERLEQDFYAEGMTIEDMPAHYENPILTHSGACLQVLWSNTILRNDAGQPVGLTCLGQDITEERRTREALRHSEERYREILESIQEGYYEVDLEGNFTFFNDALCRICGYSEEEMHGLNYRHLYADESTVQRVYEAYNRVFRTGESVQVFDCEPLRKDGAKALLEVSISPMPGPDGKTHGFRGIVRDVSEHREAERALRDSEERYRELFENANDIVYTHDLEGNLTSLNKAGERISGYSREEALKLNVMDIIAPEYRDLASKMVARKVANGGEDVTRYELEILGKEGRRIPIEVSTRVIRRGGQAVGIQGIARDITERKRGEEKRSQLEAQIRHTQKLEGLGVLAGGIAHDFNNLLVGILGNAGLALMKMPPRTPARSYVEKIEETAQRAAVLTNQMLAYSGKGAFVVQPLDLSRLAQDMGHLLSAAISKKAVLKYNCASGLPLIEGDAAQLQQVVMNLITNASDALGDDPGVITLSTMVVNATRSYLSETYLDDDLDEGFYVSLEVSDTGCGMDAETQARMFDPFYSTKFAGRGLGLAAVLGIVRGHRGAVKVYSEPGHGTMFKVLFPAAQCGEKRSEVERISDEYALLDEWRASGLVLVADDEESVRAVARETLTERGFTVLTAEDGREAVEVFAKHAGDIVAVLLDLTMPVMSGEQTFDEMQKIRPEVPIILTSGYTEQDAVERFSGKEPAAFIQKPYPPRELVKVFQNVLNAKD
ncbi:MAG TPA: PAS domain S-box protein [Candidatus Hydrogenedentes bacterium]|nr:PAS domain S-box protein [Candidatus Hydrogenedentota bacterium]